MKRRILGSGAAVLAVALLVVSTGFYVIPRYELATSCDTCVERKTIEKAQTIWFFRLGLDAPFIASDGGMLIRYKKAGHSLFERIRLTVDWREQVLGRTILHLPYVRLLYRLSAEGRLPLKFDEAF